MGLSFLFIFLCLVLGGAATFALRGPDSAPIFGASLKEAALKRFSPKNSLFIVGPTANHAPCRLQRRLLKPALAALIREDVTVVEIYGDERPRKNGEELDWLDPSLLRHALGADEGFYVIYVDEDGKTVLKSEAPMLTADILAKAGLDIPGSSSTGSKKRKSAILKRLRAA
ncbi:MAG TPA: hypothetical protein PK585_06030 [Amphiplicatus sp.]|nr:hypothetical protein [Amphiplicatus sp.]